VFLLSIRSFILVSVKIQFQKIAHGYKFFLGINAFNLQKLLQGITIQSVILSDFLAYRTVTYRTVPYRTSTDHLSF
jgi:hypothetical protein